MRIQSAAVIGTGMMGPGIAAILAIGGIPSTVLSRSADSAAAACERALGFVELLREHGLASEAAELRGSSDLEAIVPTVDLVIESAPEDMAFKQDLFARLDAIAKPDAILASNTSGLSITAIASKCARVPERVVTAHFWNPPHLVPLVEIVRGERTSLAVAEELRDLLRACGKVPVMVKKDTPGQLGNRIQSAVVRECMHILEQGIADVEDIDLAVKNGFGIRLPEYGVFEHADAVGLDLAMAVADYVTRDLSNRVGASDAMKERVERGELGVKSGKGFYDWSKKDWGEVRGRRDGFVLDVVKRRRARLKVESDHDGSH